MAATRSWATRASGGATTTANRVGTGTESGHARTPSTIGPSTSPTGVTMLIWPSWTVGCLTHMVRNPGSGSRRSSGTAPPSGGRSGGSVLPRVAAG